MRRKSKTRRTLPASWSIVAATLSRLLDSIKAVANRRRRAMVSGRVAGAQGAAVLVPVPIEDARGEIRNMPPGKDQEPRVVGNQVQAVVLMAENLLSNRRVSA